MLSSQPKVDFPNVLSHRNGLIKAKPYRSRWGFLPIIPIIGVSSYFTYLGMMVAKNFAETLEEWNLYEYVPKDDD